MFSRSNLTKFRESARDFFKTRKGIAVIVAIILVLTYFFNTVFGSMLGQVITIAIIVAATWAQRVWHKRKGVV